MLKGIRQRMRAYALKRRIAERRRREAEREEFGHQVDLVLKCVVAVVTCVATIASEIEKSHGG